jgi:type I restriction enzyme S subunit
LPKAAAKKSLSKETAQAKTKKQKPMSKNSENKLIPRLRFPEFQHSGEWEVKKLGEVLIESRVQSEVNDPRKRITVRLNQKGVQRREYRGTEAEDATIFFKRRKGQFIYGKQNLHKGAFGIIPNELDSFESSQDIPAFDFNSGYDPYYFVYYLGQEKIYTDLEKLSTGTGSKRIHPKDFFQVEFPFPSLPEQQKIAACLSSLDEVIAGERQKLALLQQHKKGLLQQLFPQEGETVPTLRFKEFEDSGEWEEIELGSLGEFVSGGTPDTTNPEFWEGEIQWFTPTEIKQRFISKSKRTITKAGLENSSAKLLPKGSLLITTRATIGDAAINEVDCATNQGFQSIIFKQNEFNLFWYYWLLNNKNELVKRASGSTFQEINKAKIKKITAKRPNIFEQQKIASCLSSLDDIITAQTQKIELLEQHKKGLLQGLFPNVNDHE